MDSEPVLSVTVLLQDWRNGDNNALNRLLPLVYQDLHAQAGRYLRQERGDHTLQPTALVHEAFIRLIGTEVPWQDKAHFMAIAARVMRRVLVDHARAKKRNKRAGDWARKTLEEGLILDPSPTLDLVELDAALDRLSEEDERAGEAAELHYFGGLSYQQTAEVLQVSEATVHRDLRFAKAWLMNALGGETP